MTHRTTTITALLAVLAFVAAACGGADSETFSEIGDQLSNRERGVTATTSAPAVPGALPAETTLAAGESSRGDAAAPTTAEENGAFGRIPENPPTDVITQDYGTNPFVTTGTDQLSTFALDVDTGSYTVARNWVLSGTLPDPALVRVEEFVNFFDQDYPAPLTDTFAVYADGAPTPFATSSLNHLVRIGIKAREVAEAARPDANLTFVVDVSGSMNEGGRMEIVKDALGVLVDELRSSDSVAIVAYDSQAWVVLDPTPASQRSTILGAIAELEPGGSTNAEAGLTLGYDLADHAHVPGAINRVILLSDGVANVGTTSAGGILDRISQRAEAGINLVSVGVGLGNYNDVLLEQLADQGDGFYAYVDSQAEAKRLFSTDLTGTLLTVAEEAKVQVEFNPDTVSAYRLLGFENRAIADDQFRNDSVDAGEIGAGHEVTALYEVTLTAPITQLGNAELATVYLRWRDPGDTVFQELPGVLPASVLVDDFVDSSAYFQLDVVAAAYAEVLRASPWATELDLSWVAGEAARVASIVDDPAAWDFAELVADAARLAGQPVPVLQHP